MRADNEEEMGAEKRPTLDRKRLTDPEVPRSPSRERLRLLAPEGGNMQHLTLPSSMTYSAGGRLGSIVSHKSEDALSSVSVGSILRSTGEVDDYFWEASSSLVLSQLEKLPLKDFSSEIRANMDIKLFIKEATLLLNLEASTLEDIIHEMLTAVFSNTTGASGGLNGDVIEHNSSLAVGGHSTSNFRVTPVISPTAADSATLPHGISTSELNSPTSEALPVDTLIEKAKKALFLQITLNEHSYYRLCKTIKAVSVHDDDQMLTDQSWICALCSLKEVHKRYVAMARLAYPVNLGRSSEGTQIILLVISPLREKKTKCDTELGRTFATILSDLEFRRQLIYAADENEVKSLLWARAHELQIEQEDAKRQALKVCELPDDLFQPNPGFHLFRGVISDLRRKIPFYPSDFLDAYRGAQTIRKVISAIFFLYFFCLLPSLAFGVLNAKNTMGKIGVFRVLLSQVVGGLCYGVIGGQPLIILLSTAPLALYIKLIFCVTQTYQIDFYAFFGCVGLFNAGFLFIYAAVDASKVMRWSTRSTEEIFAFFVSIAFLVEAYRDLVKEFETYYSCQSAVTNGSEQQRSKQAMLNTAFSPTNSSNYLADDTEGGTPARQLKRALTRVLRASLRNETPLNISLGNLTTASPEYPACKPEVSMLYLLLMFCTLWMFISMLNFTKTPFLTERKRELLRDVALPSTVLVMSFIGSYVFRHIDLKPFEVDSVPFEWEVVSLHRLDWIAALGALVLAFPLSLLFFMEQNIASAIVNSPSNKQVHISVALAVGAKERARQMQPNSHCCVE
nr:unnamed protein product [Spirometra erinaceieuropaei]